MALVVTKAIDLTNDLEGMSLIHDNYLLKIQYLTSFLGTKYWRGQAGCLVRVVKVCTN